MSLATPVGHGWDSDHPSFLSRIIISLFDILYKEDLEANLKTLKQLPGEGEHEADMGNTVL